MTGTVEFIQRIRYVEIPDEKGEMQVYAIPETVEDVRELVRCKDCRKNMMCELTLDKPKDWFCADGKKEGR